MEIRKIHLRHFGKFTDQVLEFHSGVNVIYGENETGKSTICSFIKGMLFGIERSRGRAARTDEYVLRQPWDNPSYFEGSMEFVSGGKTFYLERCFSAKEKRAILICKDDGEELDVEQGDLKALLDDWGEDIYGNTLYVANCMGQSDEELAREIHNYLVNASTGNFARIDVIKAAQSLQKQRKDLEARKKKQVEEMTSASRELQVRMEYEQQEIRELIQDEKRTGQELALLREEYQEKKEPEADYDSDEEGSGGTSWILGKVVLFLLAVAGIALGFLGGQLKYKVLAGGIVIAACICLSLVMRKEQRLREELREREQEFLLRSKEELEWKAANLEWIVNTRREKERDLEALQEEYEELQKSDAAIQKLEVEISAIHLAQKTIEEVTEEIYEECEDQLNEQVSRILSQITGGKYDRIMIDDKRKVRVYAGERVLGLEQVSRGTMDQICFALRMAAGEILNSEETLPILLDDAFLCYDDERLKNTLKWLTNSSRQVLLFSCQSREKEIIRSILEN